MPRNENAKFGNDESILRAREHVEKEMLLKPVGMDIRTRPNLDLLDGVPEELMDLLGSDDEFNALTWASLPEVTFDLSELLSSTDGAGAEVEAEYLVEEIFGMEIVSTTSDLPPLRDAVDSHAEFRQMVQRTIAAIIAAAQNGDPRALAIVRKREARPLVNNEDCGKPSSSFAGSQVRRARSDFALELAARAQELDSSSALVAFLKSYASSDQPGMQAVIRELAK